MKTWKNEMGMDKPPFLRILNDTKYQKKKRISCFKGCL